ncbi:DNA repair protein RecO [Candidatus Berkelbacteria bacterium]|nr:DNA repair protein RecO [Candidatus Berkelbacteria bacterium]
MNSKCRGIVIKRIDVGEADRLLVIFTDTLGKITARAKGIKKGLSRLAGHLEPYQVVSLWLHEGNRGNQIPLLIGAELLETFPSISSSLKKTGLAFYFGELVDKTISEKDPHPEIFELLVFALRGLRPEKIHPLLVSFFELNLLRFLGLKPPLLLLNKEPEIKKMLTGELPEVFSEEKILTIKSQAHLFLVEQVERKFKSLEFLQKIKI